MITFRMTFIAKLRTLRPSRPFGVAQDMLCGTYSEIWLRRQPRWVLRGERNPRFPWRL
jgi:hypothetical protein